MVTEFPTNQMTMHVCPFYLDDHAANMMKGRILAQSVILRMQENDNNPTLIAHVVREMIKSGRMTGVWTGFSEQIATRLLEALANQVPSE